MKISLFSVIYLCLITQLSISQADSIIMLNGKVYHGKIEGVFSVENDSIVRFGDDKGKVDEISTYRIYSYVKSGKESILYHQDEFKGNYLNIKDTKAVTYGSYDARQTFKPRVPFWSSLAIGLGASIFDTYISEKTASDPNNLDLEAGFFKRSPSFFPLLIPPVISLAWSFPSFKLKSKKVQHMEYFKNENFYRGYHRIAKQKRMLSSLLGSLVGAATGMTIYYIAQ